MKNVSLGELVTNALSGFASGERDANGIIQVRMNNVDTEGRLDLSVPTRVPKGKGDLNGLLLVAGDVLFNNTNSVELVGKSAVFLGHHEPVTFSNHFTRLQVQLDRLDPCYLGRWLTYQQKSKTFELLSNRWVNQSAVPRASLLKLKIPVPPLAEQKRIAAILDQADAVRRKRQHALQLAEDFPSNIFYEMFGDPVHDPKGWPVVPLEGICTRITDGVHAKPSYTEGGVPFISVKDITTGKLTFDDCKFIAEKDHRQFTKRCRPELMDILYTKVGATYGRPALVDTKREFSIYVSVALIKPNSKLVDPTFLHEAMASKEVKRQADRSVKGAGVPDLHLIEIRSFKLPLPPMPVQREFVKQTEIIHGIQERMRSSLKETDDLFNSLVQRAFRGEM